jgi:hypothetical protein
MEGFFFDFSLFFFLGKMERFAKFDIQFSFTGKKRKKEKRKKRPNA